MSTEQATHGTADLAWFKSSYSGSNGGDCVEVGHCPGVVHVRDSKDLSQPHLNVTSHTWDAFLTFATGQDEAR